MTVGFFLFMRLASAGVTTILNKNFTVFIAVYLH